VAKQQKTSIVRNVIGLVALVAVAVVGILEVRARSGAIQAVKRLEDAQDDLETNRFAPALSKEQVQIILGRPPTGPDVEEGPFEMQIYVWNGVFRKHTLRAVFSGGKPKTLESIGLD